MMQEKLEAALYLSGTKEAEYGEWATDTTSGASVITFGMDIEQE